MTPKTNRLTKPHTTRSRRHGAGLSILEFLACTVAVIGGAWLGALYLGVDVKQLTYTALSDAHLLDKVPPSLRPADPNSENINREQLRASLHNELGSLRNQIAALHSGGEASPAPAPVARANSSAAPGPQPSKQKTFEYWSRLNEIATGNEKLQRDAESAANAANAAKVFAVKSRICRFSAKAIEALPMRNVDDSVLCFGSQLRQWYDRGGELYDRAVKVLETPMGQQARTQLNDEWKKADEQHQNEERLLYENASAVRGSMSRVYGAEFPEFGQQAKASAGNNSTGNAG
jgi:hypothetical protein